MSDRPFQLIMNTVLAASGAGSLSFQIDTNTKLKLNGFVFTATAAFSITGIRDSDGTLYSNASPSNPILSTMIQNATNSNRSADSFLQDLVIDGGKTFYIDLLDTSGAQNTVRMLFEAVRIT